MAFVYDQDNQFHVRVNADTLLWQRVTVPHWQEVLHTLVARHAEETSSRYASMLLHEWNRTLPLFWQVVPKEYAKYLPVPLAEETQQPMRA
jgi:glutamate synthase (NADPH/NADH) large chain